MNEIISLTPKRMLEFLLHVAVERAVFIWGPPGVGKSALVQQFADKVGLPCISLLGSQLAPEDIIGVPRVTDDVSYFCPPRIIAQKEPYVLFLDELNACSHEVQKAFYSLILERRIGEYYLPKGSIIIAAGNRAQDSAIVKPMSSALINRIIHVGFRVSNRDWLDWAKSEHGNIHPLIVEYLQSRPDHLWSEPPKTEVPFSTPRSWHAFSDTLKSFGDGIDPIYMEALAAGCLSHAHSVQFRAFIKMNQKKFILNDILKGDAKWPAAPEDRDLLYFLTHSFRAQLMKELPPKETQSGAVKDLTFRAKRLMKELAEIELELAQLVVAHDEKEGGMPEWFMVDLAKDLPRIMMKRKDKQGATT